MFENYKATKEDFQAIEEGINSVWHSKLNFVFENKKLVEKVITASYDSKNLYIWSQAKFPKFTPFKCNLKQYFAYKIPYSFKISDRYQRGWRAGLEPRKLTWILLSKLKIDEKSAPCISGGLLIPFITLQKKMWYQRNNPYITYESYLATIVHEFGHAYWHQCKLWYYSNKKDNILLLKIAKQLYSSKTKKLVKILIRFPAIEGMTELFAHCVEYQTSSIFWSTHKQNLDMFAANRIEYLLRSEKLKDLNQEDSVIEPSRYPHDFALVLGKIILTLYPKTWPQVLTASHISP